MLHELRMYGHEAYFVGGCVRDSILGLIPKDYDVATSATPEQVLEVFPDAKPVGAKFGVMLVGDIEVATFRKEADHQGHDCTVEWADLKTDASRRDFTINAMYFDGTKVIDFFGGQEDLKNKVLRTVGKAERRFMEDPLRMLRAIRFATKYDLTYDNDLILALEPRLLATISAERIRDEVVQILRYKGLRDLYLSGLLTEIMPEVADLNHVEQDARHPEGNVLDHTALVLDALLNQFAPSDAMLMAALLHDVGKKKTQKIEGDKISFINHEDSEIPEQIMRRLKFSNEVIDCTTWLVKNHMRMHRFFDMKKSKRNDLVRHKWFGLLRKLHEADCLGSFKPSNEEAIENYVNSTVIEEPKTLCSRLVTGDDLIALGFKPGPQMGAVLKSLEEAQRDGEFSTKEEGLLLFKKELDTLKDLC